MTNQEIISLLQQNADKQYQQFSKKIVNGTVPVLGVRLPVLRNIAKSLTLLEAIDLPANLYHEIDHLRGFVFANAKLPFEQKSEILLQFATTIDNWAVCDSSVAKFGKAQRQQYFSLFEQMLSSDQPFVCRYGVVNMSAHFLTQDYVDKVFDALSKIKLWGEYYVDMAVAWLVATAMAKCRDSAMQFMQNEGKTLLPVFCYNKALQKMRDSFRVSQQDKQWTYENKRYE